MLTAMTVALSVDVTENLSENLIDGDTESSTQNRNLPERNRQARRTTFPRRPQIARIGSDDALASLTGIFLWLPQITFPGPLRDHFRLGAVQGKSSLLQAGARSRRGCSQPGIHRDHWRRPRHYGSGQPWRERRRRAVNRLQHHPAVRA